MILDEVFRALRECRDALSSCWEGSNDIIDRASAALATWERRVDYDRIPERVRRAIDAHAEEGRPTGDFVRACLENNLREAVVRADAESLAALPDITFYLINKLPGRAWGDPTKVASWRARTDIHSRRTEAVEARETG